MASLLQQWKVRVIHLKNQNNVVSNLRFQIDSLV